jgi:two-component system nitrate/nitrite response regulator NarL
MGKIEPAGVQIWGVTMADRVTEAHNKNVVVRHRTYAQEESSAGQESPIRIIVADDRRLCRECVRLLIESIDPDLEVVEAEHAERIRERLTSEPGHCVVLYNLVITDVEGIEYVASLSKSIGDVPLVVMCDTSERELMKGCLERGAKAFLPSTTAGPMLVAILRLVLAKGVYAPPELVLDVDFGKHAEAMSGRKRTGNSTRREAAIAEHFPMLTRRQRDVLALISLGMSNREIADNLEMCENTVKAHVKQVMRKLRAENRTQAALMADRLVA